MNVHLSEANPRVQVKLQNAGVLEELTFKDAQLSLRDVLTRLGASSETHIA